MYYNLPYSGNVCRWNMDYYGRTYLRCSPPRVPRFCQPYQPPDPTTCAHLFSTNQEVPVPCCSIFGIGCTPGNNRPISYSGLRNF